MEKEEIKHLLQARGQEQEDLFSLARKARQKEFGDGVFIRAIIEPANYCRMDCHYCPIRKHNKSLKRYKMDIDEILNLAEEIIKNGVKVFSLETGEDPGAVNIIAKATSILKQKGCWILGALGNLKTDDYKKLKDAGMDAYLLKFETSDPVLFEKLRPKSTLKRRLDNLEYLRKLGFKISTGNIVGLPKQSIDSIVNDILLLEKIQPEMVTVSPFISPPHTPLGNYKYGDSNLTLNNLAIYRILFPKSHIPALCAWNFYPGLGQVKAFEAGANEILINTANPNSKAYNFAIYSTDKRCIPLEEGLKVIKKAGLKFDTLKNLPKI